MAIAVAGEQVSVDRRVSSASVEALFWLIALIGLVPAIAAETVVPLNWFLSLESPPLDARFLAAPISYAYPACLAAGLALLAWSRRILHAVALLPLAVLSFAAPASISIDARFLSSELHIAALGGALPGYPDLPIDAASSAEIWVGSCSSSRCSL